MSSVLPELERDIVAAAARSSHGARLSPRPPRRRPRARLAALSATAAVVVAVLVLIETTGGNGERGGSFNAAAAVLSRFADRAQAGLLTPTQELGAGQAWYTESVLGTAWNWRPPTDSDSTRFPLPPIFPLIGGGYSGRAIVTNRATNRSWTRANGLETNRMTPRGPVTFYGSAAERSSWNRHKSDPGASQSGFSSLGFTIGSRPASYQQLLSLPTSGKRLLAVVGQHLRATLGSASSSASNEVHALATLLTEPIPDAVRAAAFRALGQVPHVLYLGHVHDLLGRAGIGIAYDTTSQDTV